MLKVEITGFKELSRRLKKLPEKIERKVLGQAANAGAAVVRKSARKRVPVKTGFLKKNIMSRKKRGKFKGEVTYMVGPSADAFYGQFIESGFIATGPKKAGVTVREARGRARKKGNKHYPAHPFLRPAFDGNRKQIIEAMRKRLAKGIDKEIAKFGKI